MEYIIIVIRGIIVGFVISLAVFLVSEKVASIYYPFEADTYYLPGYGTYSPSSVLHDEATAWIFAVAISVFTTLFVILYLYLRRRFYFKHPEYR